MEKLTNKDSPKFLQHENKSKLVTGTYLRQSSPSYKCRF